MNSADAAVSKAQINTFNKGLGREIDQTLDKDDFLEILITQLTHQDPTEPMKDKEFVAQMAQFSSLEQMTNMSQEFTKLASVMSSGQAMGLVGKTVSLVDGESLIEGRVTAVTTGDFPQVKVGNKYYDFETIESVMEQEAAL